MRKSRKYKGGNLTSVDCAKNPQLCPTQTEHGGSLMKMAAASTKQQAATAASQSIASKHLASGGGKKKKVLFGCFYQMVSFKKDKHGKL